MRRNGRLLIVLGVVLLLGALLLAVFALAGGDDNDTPTAERPRPQDVTVVRARRDIDAHTVLRPDDVEEITVRDDTLTGDEARSAGEVIGFAYRTDLVQGQRLMREGLEVSGIAQDLAPGSRAISVSVSRNNTVAGLVRQDDRIDIVYKVNLSLLRVNPTTPLELSDNLQLSDLPLDLEGYDFEDFPEGPIYPYPGDPGSRFAVTDVEGGNPVVKLVIQNLRILRVVQPSSSGQTGTSTNEGDYLVLEVTPEQAELLHLIQTVGTYQIMLRGSEDDGVAQTPGINMQTLVTNYGLPVPGTITLPGPGAQ
jgi:Flp pilus assembly protein CpaB